ncbi:MAG: phosphopantothenoylcysteine decarboxylase [Planctomycetes bacterium]|nr:phosphopantothenoylcysteine decarboxylase [Planctomycetota bacterium]
MRPKPPAASDSGRPPLAGSELLLCVCGGIAAYKSAALVSALVQKGCGVSVAMTSAARRFIAPLTFQALSGRPVRCSLWRGESGGPVEHLSLGENAELIVVAPATANIMAKLAAGIADDLISATLLGAACPVLLAPAMNERMWLHAATQHNVEFLRSAGCLFVGPNSGWQACRAVGQGRMAEPEEILKAIIARLTKPRRRARR